MDVYVDECFEPENMRSSEKTMHVSLDAKYEEAEINKVMNKECQNLTKQECKWLHSLLKIFEDIFDWNLGIWNAPPIDLELKGDAKPVCSFPYTGLNAHKFMLKKS